MVAPPAGATRAEVRRRPVMPSAGAGRNTRLARRGTLFGVVARKQRGASRVQPDQACHGHRAAAPMGRREVLRAGSLGLLGLGLPGLLRARSEAPARRAGQARACILLFMWGGPAQQDTWDPKPGAPA